MRLPHLILAVALLLAGSFVFSGCENDAKDPAIPPSTAPATPPMPKEDQVSVPRFDMDSAYAFVAAQVAFGPRVMNTAAHDAAGEWMVDKLEEFGATVERQKFTATAYDGTPLKSMNIIGRYNPEMEDRILLAAHWDTRHVADSPLETDPAAVINGADDGASGVGVLLEIARQLGQSAPHIGVDIVLFDAEDYGDSSGKIRDSYALGSQYYSNNLKGIRPRYGVLLDMVGARDAEFAIEQFSQRFAPQVVRKVWKLAADMGYVRFFPQRAGSPITDDHYYVNTIAKIPMIDIINHEQNNQTPFVKHWHTGNDNMDKIDKRTLRAVGQVLTALVYREGNRTI
ncbi:MAG: glutaminyl-peptide cyclotransferase [Neolewinella sp.]